MPKPSTPAVWASGKTFGFQPSPAQQAQGFDYIASVRPGTGAPITDDHDWPLNSITSSLKWLMDQIPDAGIKSAAFRDVGVSSGNIPDMSFWTKGAGWRRSPDGVITQWGLTPASQSNVVSSVLFNIPFVSSCDSVQLVFIDAASTTQPSRGNPVQLSGVSKTGFSYCHAGESSFAQFLWRAEGV